MSNPDDGKTQEDEEKQEAESPEFAATKKEFIQTFFKRASEFTEELLRENERLRYRIAELEAQQPQASDTTPVKTPTPAPTIRDLLTRIRDLEQERERMLANFQNVEAQNQDFQQRYKDIERENNNLANLYVASFQLHSTLDLREVRQVIVEILLNLIGAKVFAIFLLDEQAGVLKPLAVEGMDRARIGLLDAGEGILGRVIKTGQPEIGGSHHGPFNLQEPAIVTPLRIKDRVVGAIVVWEFLRQKTGIEEVDHELFNLLAAHAASALQGAKLATELRDRSTPLWGVVDLI